MDYSEIIQSAFDIENIIEIGEEITLELEVVTNLLRKNFDQVDLFFEDNDYKGKSINKSLLNYLRKKIDLSEININKFEEELELISNYKKEDLLDLKSDFIEKLDLANDVNIFLRMELEEYIRNLDYVKGIVEDITKNLNKQKTDKLLGSNLLM